MELRQCIKCNKEKPLIKFEKKTKRREKYLMYCYPNGL